MISKDTKPHTFFLSLPAKECLCIDIVKIKFSRSCKVFSLSFHIQDQKDSENNLVHHLYTNQFYYHQTPSLEYLGDTSPSNSHNSDPSKLTIVTSKSGLSSLTQTSFLLNSNDLRVCNIVLIICHQ